MARQPTALLVAVSGVKIGALQVVPRQPPWH
jgi:hypothetical protein